MLPGILGTKIGMTHIVFTDEGKMVPPSQSFRLDRCSSHN